ALKSSRAATIHVSLVSISVVGQVDNLRADWQSAQPGEARLGRHPSPVWFAACRYAGQVDILRTDCQSVPPGNARLSRHPSRVWLRPQAALGSSAANNVLDFFSSLFSLPVTGSSMS